jgi:predicted CxxxxCH...CXXCH cytochrome family protein
MCFNRTVSVAFAAGLAALVACGTARNADSLSATTCASCHGGTDNLSGAPPNDLHGNTATTGIGVGHHTAHVEAGVACATCHPDRPAVRTPGHMDGKVDVEFHGLAVAGGSVPSPRFDAPTATCSNVYCHGATLKSALQRPSLSWTAPFETARCASCHEFPPTAAGHPQGTDCASCHPDTVNANGSLKAGGKHVNGVIDGVAQHAKGYADRASASFHGPSAVAFLQGQLGVRDCAGCHGADLSGGVGPSCTRCHEAAGWVSPAWQANCTYCHGTRTRSFVYAADLNKAAPPEDVAGSTVGPKVGAHQKHLGSLISSGIACATCHAVPAPAAPLAHVDGTAAVALSGFGAGAYDPSTQTCATACHGATGSPAWASEAALGCTGCHGAPPTSGRHPGSESKHAFMGTNCGICHADVAGVVPNLVGKSRHLNGVTDVRLSIGTFDGTGCATACHGTLDKFPWARQ